MLEVPIISKDYYQQFIMLLWLITKLEFLNPMERLGVFTVKPKIDMEFAKDVQKVNIQSDKTKFRAYLVNKTQNAMEAKI